jgi:hypothetical protein
VHFLASAACKEARKMAKNKIDFWMAIFTLLASKILNFFFSI